MPPIPVRPARPALSYRRRAVLGGAEARWGYDAPLESYWAVVGAGARSVVVGPEHLVPTLGGLARAVGALIGLTGDDVLATLLDSQALPLVTRGTKR